MIQYKILETGLFHADGGAMFGAIPKRAWRRKYPESEDNCCLLAMNCLLVWNENRVVLLDTGVGTKDLGNLSYYKFREEKNLVEQIREAGFEAKQITDVVLSHLHFDHCGGCTEKDHKDASETKVVFPNARHWISKKQWQTALSPHVFEGDSFRSEDFAAIQNSGLLHLVDNDMELFDGFALKLFDGHTSGQIVSIIETGKETCVFPGDVIPTKTHLSDTWISAYDTEPLQSIDAKIRLKNLLKGKNVHFIFYHDAYDKSGSKAL